MIDLRLCRYAAVLLACGLGASTWAAEPQPADGNLVDSSRAKLAKWVETQQLIAKEKRDWQQEKEILQSRIELVQGEIASMQEKYTTLASSSHEADTKRAGSMSEERSARDLSDKLATEVSAFESRLRGVAVRLPEPVRAKIKPLLDRMPADPANTQVSLAERFQNVIGIVNQIDKSNADITMVNEVRTLSDGKPAEVRTIYVGLAQAYFVSVGGEAGIGRPGPDGWQWQTANELAPSITQVVEVLQSKGKPAFVPLPVTVQ